MSYLLKFRRKILSIEISYFSIKIAPYSSYRSVKYILKYVVSYRSSYCSKYIRKGYSKYNVTIS